MESNALGSDFSEGRSANAKSLGGWNAIYGYIDKKGEQVIDFQYKYAGKFSNGLALVQNTDRTASYIDKNGKVVISGIYWGTELREGYIAYAEVANGPYGIMRVIRK